MLCGWSFSSPELAVLSLRAKFTWCLWFSFSEPRTSWRSLRTACRPSISMWTPPWEKERNMPENFLDCSQVKIDSFEGIRVQKMAPEGELWLPVTLKSFWIGVKPVRTQTVQKKIIHQVQTLLEEHEAANPELREIIIFVFASMHHYLYIPSVLLFSSNFLPLRRLLCSLSLSTLPAFCYQPKKVFQWILISSPLLGLSINAQTERIWLWHKLLKPKNIFCQTDDEMISFREKN